MNSINNQTKDHIIAGVEIKYQHKDVPFVEVLELRNGVYNMHPHPCIYGVRLVSYI